MPFIGSTMTLPRQNHRYVAETPNNLKLTKVCRSEAYFRFMDLPFHIRQRVYKFTLFYQEGKDGLQITPDGLQITSVLTLACNLFGCKRNTSILTVSRQVSDEAANILYGSTTFCFNDYLFGVNVECDPEDIEYKGSIGLENFLSWLKMIGRKNRGRLRDIQIELSEQNIFTENALSRAYRPFWTGLEMLETTKRYVTIRLLEEACKCEEIARLLEKKQMDFQVQQFKKLRGINKLVFPRGGSPERKIARNTLSDWISTNKPKFYLTEVSGDRLIKLELGRTITLLQDASCERERLLAEKERMLKGVKIIERRLSEINDKVKPYLKPEVHSELSHLKDYK